MLHSHRFAGPTKRRYTTPGKLDPKLLEQEAYAKLVKQELATLIHFIQMNLEHMWKNILAEGVDDARDTDV